jgi:hypothetical protein
VDFEKLILKKKKCVYKNERGRETHRKREREIDA